MEDVLNVGAAVHLPELPLTFNWKLDPNHSVIAAELFAILKALEWVDYYGTPLANYAICSDSCSGLQLISQRRPANYKDLVFRIHLLLSKKQNNGKNVKFQWTSALCSLWYSRK